MRVWTISGRALIRAAALALSAALAVGGGLAVFGGSAVQTSRQSERRLPVYSVETEEKRVAISFDAAWGAEKTSQIMDILEEYDADATFFLVGFWVDKYPGKTAEIAERGFEIGNHSSTHPKLSTLSPEQIALEASDCARKIEAAAGVRPTLFRPPYGDYSDTVVQTLQDEGYTVIQWNVDSLDWKNLGVQSMVSRVTGSAAAGDIVLFHNNSDYIVEALPLILQHFRKEGYQVVRVSDLLLEGESYIDNTGRMRQGDGTV